MGQLIIWSNGNFKEINEILRDVFIGKDIPHKVEYETDKIPNMQDGDVVLAMGTKPLQFMQANGMLPKNRTITSLRGNPITFNGAKRHIFPTYSPSLPKFDHGKLVDIQWDARLAIRMLKERTLKPTLGTYVYVYGYEHVIERIMVNFQKTKEKQQVAIDLETVGLDPWAEDVFIVSISVTIQAGQAEMVRFKSRKDYTEKLIEQVDWLCNSDMTKVVGANFKFDMKWISHHWGIETFKSFKMDTTLVGSLCDENRSNSLNTHAKIYTDIGGYDDGFNKAFDKSRMDLVPDAPLLDYGGGDTDADFRVADCLRSELLTDRTLAQFYVHLLHPAIEGFRVMEQRGMVVDIPAYEELREEVQAKINELVIEARKIVGNHIFYKHIKNLDFEDINLAKASLLKEYFFTPRGLNLKPLMTTAKTGAPSTAMEHLLQLGEKYEKAQPLVNLLKEYTSATKTMSTYVVGFLKHLRSDGRFHPSYMMHRGDYGGDDSGTVTGRTSCKDPAYQTIPKHTIWAKPLRKVYSAPPGHVVMNVDYSQGELRVAACVAQEPAMISAYKQGLDMHLKTGAAVFGLELEEALEMKAANDPQIGVIRQGGKAGNFGLLYGMQVNGFVTYAKTTYGVDLTLEQATQFRESFFDMYPRLAEWHIETVQFAKRNKFVRSPLGRIRHLPLIDSSDMNTRSKQERQAINSPIQSTLSDLGLLAIAELNRLYPDLWVFGFTHDAVSAYIPENEVEAWAWRIKDVMENLPLKEKFGWDAALKFAVDVEVGDTMATLEEFKLSE